MHPKDISNDESGFIQSTGQLVFTNQPAFTSPLINYALHLADDALILGHRNSEWCGHGPILELDIAISNIALDLLGQARNFYQYAADVINRKSETHREVSVKEEHSEYEIKAGVNTKKSKDTHPKVSPAGGDLEGALERAAAWAGPATEDTLAYHRDPHEFKNCLLVEQPNGDWGVTMMRQFFFSTYQYYLYQQLQHSNDDRIAAITKKALKEVTYHVRWSSEWVIRLGAGTEESHARMLNAVNVLKDYTGELFAPAAYETEAAQQGYGTDVILLQPLWQQKVKEVFRQATLDETLPFNNTTGELTGKDGQHTHYLNAILTDMQYLQRAHPGAQW